MGISSAIIMGEIWKIVDIRFGFTTTFSPESQIGYIQISRYPDLFSINRSTFLIAWEAKNGL
jgi:hypothetical protein